MLVIVTAPVAPLTVIPVPATLLVTPVLDTTTAPVVGVTLIPEPVPDTDVTGNAIDGVVTPVTCPEAFVVITGTVVLLPYVPGVPTAVIEKTLVLSVNPVPAVYVPVPEACTNTMLFVPIVGVAVVCVNAVPAFVVPLVIYNVALFNPVGVLASIARVNTQFVEPEPTVVTV